MAAVLAVIVGLVLLFLWLSGHWFGRVLVLITLAPLGALGLFAGEAPLLQLIGAFALVGAWPIAKAPYWYWISRADL